MDSQRHRSFVRETVPPVLRRPSHTPRSWWRVQFVTGDATTPIASTDEPMLLLHIVNTVGAWGAGFTGALSKRWAEPERAYRQWAAGRCPDAPPFQLGAVQYVRVTPALEVVNMVAQEDIRRDATGTPPIRYAALQIALTEVATAAAQRQASIHLPRIGCGLAGARWPVVLHALQEAFGPSELPVTVYDFLTGAK